MAYRRSRSRGHRKSYGRRSPSRGRSRSRSRRIGSYNVARGGIRM
jgi:hypothetical protein